MKTALKQTSKIIYNPDDFLSRAIERSGLAKCEVIQMPLKVFKSEDEKSACQYSFHGTSGEKLKPCKKHGDTKICSPFYGHICLECEPHLKERCRICEVKRYECCC